MAGVEALAGDLENRKGAWGEGVLCVYGDEHRPIQAGSYRAIVVGT